MTDAATPRGLKGVIVADTELGDVRGLEGFYHYRQYNAVELAAKLSLEDVWHLLFDGHLPSTAERAGGRRHPRIARTESASRLGGRATWRPEDEPGRCA